MKGKVGIVCGVSCNGTLIASRSDFQFVAPPSRSVAGRLADQRYRARSGFRNPCQYPREPNRVGTLTWRICADVAEQDHRIFRRGSRHPSSRETRRDHPRTTLTCPKSANRRHRVCTPLDNFLSEDLAFTRKGQSEHDFSCWRALRPPLDAALAHIADEWPLRTITHQILYSPKLPRR
jgi:hypothetical protein